MKGKIKMALGILCLMLWITLGIVASGWEHTTWIACFSLCFSGTFVFIENLLQKKNQTELRSDEMFRKAGYASLALSFQLLLLATGAILLIDSVYPFLQGYSAKDVAAVVLMWWGMLVLLSSRYYSHHPEKTWL